jgi:hypothetical protein
MSSELNTATDVTKEQVFTIDGKDYKRSDLNTKTLNSIIIRQDLQSTRVKLSLELEKVAILQKHYDDIIASELGIDTSKEVEKK